MSSTKYLISGAQGGQTQGAVAPNRLEINDFVKVQDQFSLYIQALQHIYDQNQGDVDSFFQIAGIHGLPFVNWDAAGGTKPVDPNGWEGYCTHGSMLFPTWHRPYIALIEQAIQRAAITIAETYTVDKPRFQLAAMNLRQPFWDWAKNAVPPPEVISLEQVSIIAPNGQTIQVKNPLRRYTFHPIDPSFGRPYSQWKTTLRQPSTTGANATDNVARLTSVLRGAQSQIKTKTFNLLTRVHTWPAFSNHSVDDGGSASNSLEAIHDGIHVNVGGSGQMSDPSVAAFDPIFFLHHCNVDRLLSLWEALNPGVWVTPGDAGDGTWSIRPDAPVDQNTPLSPFWKADAAYWSSSDVITTATVGYTYPEFNGLDMGNPTQVRTAIANKVNQLYGGAALFPLTGTVRAAALAPKASSAAADPGAVPVMNLAAAPSAASEGNGTISAAAVPVEQQQHPAPAGQHPLVAHRPPPHDADRVPEWTARVEIKKYEVGCSFSVLIFLGAVPENPDDWCDSPNFVGAHAAFVNTVPDRCANCRSRRELVIEGFIHLNEGIARLSGLNSLEPEVVEPYLKENMHWRVQKVSGEAVDIDTLPSLEVTVVMTPLTLPPGAAFPVPGESRRHPRITHGRRGGARSA